jgi:molybdopterin synthase catalytic subunit
MIEITDRPLSPETITEKVRTPGSGCALAYIGLIRDESGGKKVLSVEYRDVSGRAIEGLQHIADEVREKWPVEKIAISHRVGTLNVGDINLVIAVSSAHRQEAFAACMYVVDRFKETLPTHKTETYTDGSVHISGQ